MKTNKIVQLREKPLKDGGKSLYLDINANGRRTYEFLKIYLKPETDASAKRENRTMLAAAEAIRAKRILEIQEGKAGIKPCSKKNFVEFVLEEVKAKKPNSAYSFRTALNSWVAQFGKRQNCDDITADMLRQYISKLSTDHSAVSTVAMYSRISSMLALALKKKYILSNPANELSKADLPRGKSKERSFLTIEEMKALINEPMPFHPEVKQGFLFSCFTGLRISDVRTLRWTDISDNCIVKKQKKTEDIVRIPLSDNALAWIPERGADDDLVFELPCGPVIAKALTKWIQAAGIKKHITPHCARHSFATMLISCGADLYVVSKLLGHASIVSTQIYAKIVDKQKEEAVNLIPKL